MYVYLCSGGMKYRICNGTECTLPGIRVQRSYRRILLSCSYYSSYRSATGFTSRSSKEPVILPTAPRAARDSNMDDDVPTNPPYVAYLTNLPYDVDESYLMEFFAEMKVSPLNLSKLKLIHSSRRSPGRASLQHCRFSDY